MHRTPSLARSKPFTDALLASHLTTNPQLHRSSVLSLYRSILRTVSSTPPSQARDDSFLYIKSEFLRNRAEKDVLKAHYLAQQGYAEWKTLKRYFDDMREFHVGNMGKGIYRPEKVDWKKKLEKVEREGPAGERAWKVRLSRSAR
jgi:Complex 1 protein (LYR family)